MAEGAVSTKTQPAALVGEGGWRRILQEGTSSIVSHLVLHAASHTQRSAGCYNLNCETPRECGYMVD